MQKSWGSELWLNSTWQDASARLSSGESTLADLCAAHPELLGDWARRLFGDELPIFTKLIRANFPPLVHLGFRVSMDRQMLVGWLAREQALLRQLFGALEIRSRDAFDAFMRLYSDWATRQARARWMAEDELALAEQLTPFVRGPSADGRLASWLGHLRWNRSRIVEALHEVDLRREDGNLLLTPAGVVHSIFGLSHQTHPLDSAHTTLQALFRHLRHLVGAGASDDQLRALVDSSCVATLRRGRAAPKNEAWLPTIAGGQRILVEPQQTSDTTFSVADFYTPFVWQKDRIAFRKGAPSAGLSSDEIERIINGMELSATSLEQIRRVPTLLPATSSASVKAFRLVDDPVAWPFFTAHRLDFDGAPGAAARWRGDHAPGVFQQLVVLDGEVDIVDARGQAGTLGATKPAFIPATMRGGYQLVTTGAAQLLVFSVPGPRGGFPNV
jgi:hypothetical protein